MKTEAERMVGFRNAVDKKGQPLVPVGPHPRADRLAARVADYDRNYVAEGGYHRPGSVRK